MQPTWTVLIPAHPTPDSTVHFLFMVQTLASETPTPLEGPIDWTIEEGGWVEVVPDYGEWPSDTKAPETTVCQARDDHQHYKVFNRPEDVPRDQFDQTGWNWGGRYNSRKGWDQFTRNGLLALLDFVKIPDNDPPGAMDEVMRAIRGAR